MLTDFKAEGGDITGEYYAELLLNLRESIKQNQHKNSTRGARMLQDNALQSQVAQIAIRECGFEKVNHSPYSPDLLALSGYHFANYF